MDTYVNEADHDLHDRHDEGKPRRITERTERAHRLYPSFYSVSGMTHLQLVKAQPQVFTAKCGEPQVKSSNAGMKEGAKGQYPCQNM